MRTIATFDLKQTESEELVLLLKQLASEIPDIPSCLAVLSSRENLTKFRQMSKDLEQIPSDVRKKLIENFISGFNNHTLFNQKYPELVLKMTPGFFPKHLRHRRLFTVLELTARILPLRVRTESFEPAYNDAKADFLRSKSQYRGKFARKWLSFCFGVHVAIMLWQCGCGMFSNKVKGIIVKVLPELFRKLLGI